MKKLFLLAGIALITLGIPSREIKAAPEKNAAGSVKDAGSSTPQEAHKTAHIKALQKILSTLHPQTGDISLKGGLARFNLPKGFQFLNEKDSRTVLVDLWRNPPQIAEEALGMIIQSPGNLLTAEGWGVIITYSEDGHVDDSDAAKINYGDLLKQMQAGIHEANAEREKNGYPSMELVGWAEPPHYDPVTHKIYWAKELAFGGNTSHTLNYCIRILGRRGVLELNTVAPISSLLAIRQNSHQILDSVDFGEGHRYADYDHNTDHLASYGIAALVAGGIAGKMGFFKMLLMGALAAKKFVIIGALGAASAISRFFKRKKK